MITKTEKYKIYYEHYKHLDALIWRVPLLVIGLISLFAALVTNKIQDNVFLQMNIVLGTILFIFSCISGVACFSMWRIGLHFRKLDRELMELEEEGYFRDRVKNHRFWTAQTSWRALLLLISIVFFVASLVVWVTPNFYNKYLPQKSESVLSPPIQKNIINY